MPETIKLLKRFALCSLLLLCLTAMICGTALVDANTRTLSLGEQGRAVAFSMDRETVTFTMDGQAYPLPALLRYARLAPPPIGTLIYNAECIMLNAELIQR